MHRFIFTAVFLVLAIYSATATAAHNIVPSGQCAVIVASRPSIQAARQYITNNGWQNVARVFESSNGWFAIASRMIQNRGSTATLSRMKSSGVIPNDAYCSTGTPYVREVNWRSNDPAPDRSVSIGLWSEFDARPLTKTEKRFLQAGLAMHGHYSGLLDGVWGNGSQSALERYTAAEFDNLKPVNAHVAYLTSQTFDRWVNDGWAFKHVTFLDFSMMLPKAALRLEEKDGTFEKWSHSSKDLVVIFDDLNDYGLADLHQEMVAGTDGIGKPYKLRNSTIWVTSSQTSNGTIYIRSDLIYGSWSTVAILAGHSITSEAALISASIRPGDPIGILPSENGTLLSYTSELIRSFEENVEPRSPAPPSAGLARSEPQQPSGEAPSSRSTGTAFFVTDDGVALTNAHVVDGCLSLSLGGQPAEIISVSSAFDLAALKLSASGKTTPLKFSKNDAALNSDITIAGYPLHGLLGGLNVSRGSVSSMKGLEGDETIIQISAPVQPGNSGGPAIDRHGGVVGVVVSKLDTVALAGATGDIAQNVNFAIRGSLAKVFLSSNRIEYLEVGELGLISPEKAAEILESSTSLIECSH